jgi:hypothetical protein
MLHCCIAGLHWDLEDLVMNKSILEPIAFVFIVHFTLMLVSP